MLVTDRHRAGKAFLQSVDSAVDGGVDVVQIREKDLDHSSLLALARDIVTVVENRAKVVVNTDASVAIELEIGLHLPETSPALSHDLENQLGDDVLVGRSIHSADKTDEERIDYLLFGHVFATTSKPDLQPRGLVKLAEIALRSTKPVWAIGGITAANAGSVIEHGAHGVAVIGAILGETDPHAATIALRREIDQATKRLIAHTRTTK